MKSKKIEIELNCSREEMQDFIKNNDTEYIKNTDNQNSDVCLSLLWKQHCEPIIECYYVANYNESKLLGEIVYPHKTKDKTKDKIKLKDLLTIFFSLIVGIMVSFGLPFLILFAITDNLIVGLTVGLTILIFLLVKLSNASDHTKQHEQNIRTYLGKITKKEK